MRKQRERNNMTIRETISTQSDRIDTLLQEIMEAMQRVHTAETQLKAEQDEHAQTKDQAVRFEESVQLELHTSKSTAEELEETCGFKNYL